MSIDRETHLNISEQIELLTRRGLLIEDTQRAWDFLSNISYYRLGYYLRDFYTEDTNYVFRKGASFDNILKHYFFDRELRLLVFDMIERLEIAFRTQISYQYSLDNSEKWWYTNSENFIDKTRHKKDIQGIANEIIRSKEAFIQPYKNPEKDSKVLLKYPPSWVTFEVITMTSISKLFDNLILSERKKNIPKYFKLYNGVDVLQSWMQSISYVRNICAHHSKLWNRPLILRPMIPKKTMETWLTVYPVVNIKAGEKQIELERIYVFLSCGLYLLKIINPDTHFVNKLKALIALYPEIDLKEMGFPKNWEEEPLWQPNSLK